MKYFASGWGTMIAEVICSGSSWNSSVSVTPMLGVLLGVWVARAWQRWTVAALLALPVVWYLLLLAGWVTPATR